MSVNKALLIGRLGQNPEVRFTPQGTAVATISVATSESWKDKATGEKRETTEWHRVVMYRALAEIAGEYLQKGSLVYIEGKIKTRKYQDKQTGQDRYSTEIVADQMQMLHSRSQNDGHEQQRPTPQRNSYAEAKQGRSTDIGNLDEDIPF